LLGDGLLGRLALRLAGVEDRRTTAHAQIIALPGLNRISIDSAWRTGLSRDANVALRLLARYVLTPLAPFIKYWSTPERAARVITEALTGTSHRSGVYYDENGVPMTGSAQVRDPAFADRVVAETRELLATTGTDVALLRGTGS
jgi:hypothetical protein